VKRLLANLTDGLFGYRLRYRRWRRWPLLAALALVWLPLALAAAPYARDMVAGQSVWGTGREFARLLYAGGALGQLVLAAFVALFAPLLAARAFAREKVAGNMMDLVLLPVERRRIVHGRLARVLLPFVLLVVWSLPVYLAVPLWQETTWGTPPPLMRLSLSAPMAFTGAFIENWDHSVLDWVGGWDVWRYSSRPAFTSLPAHLTGIVPWLTVLSEVWLVAVLGFCFSLRCRRPWGAALLTYVSVASLAVLEMLPLAILFFLQGWEHGVSTRAQDVRMMTTAVTIGIPLGAVLVRGLTPALLLRRAVRHFDGWALGEG
jgi:hypothetical protein